MTTGAEPLDVTDESFAEEIENADGLTMVDFWAEWCGPCRMVSPIVEELAGEYEGRLKVMKMNVDDNPQTPSRYGVRGIPNLILFKAGQVADQIVGAVPKGHLVKAIDRTLG